MSNAARASEVEGRCISRGWVFGCCIVVAAVMMHAACATAQVNSALSAQAIAWAKANIGNYKTYVSYARDAGTVAVPVPPQIDPPCQVCGDNSKTQAQADVDAWVKQSADPEATYMTGLATMDRQIIAFGGAGSSQLTPAAQDALAQFESDADFTSDVSKLAGHLLNYKAIPMAEQYDQDPQRAYAGLSFLTGVASTASRVQQRSTANPVQQQVTNLEISWVQSVVNKIDDDVTAGHKYNLCPTYVNTIRDLELLGGPQVNMDAYIKMVEKLQDLVTFDVTLKLAVKTDNDDGSHMYATWNGKARFKLNLDLTKGCYTPLFDNNSQMSVSVSDWDAISIETEADGTKQQIPVALSSSKSYNVTLDQPQLNLCDPEPIFQIPLANLKPPQEVVTAKGQTASVALFVPFLTTIVNQSDLASLQGPPTSAPPQDSSSSGAPGTDSDLQQIKAHQGDAAWLMSPAGQAVVADLQKQALNQAKSAAASHGLVLPDASTMAGLTESIASARLPWTNGLAEPVNKTMQVKIKNSDIELTISVQQAPSQ